jgi:hypothetical protein
VRAFSSGVVRGAHALLPETRDSEWRLVGDNG